MHPYSMAVLVQRMLAPEVSFVLHTTHPITGDKGVAYAELALGHGETLASGAVRGTPWRLSIDRGSGACTVHTFASFATALVRDDSPSGGAGEFQGLRAEVGSMSLRKLTLA